MIYKYVSRAVFFPMMLLALVFCSSAYAEEGDRFVNIIFSGAPPLDAPETALIRGKDVWVPAEVLRSAGLSLRDGPNGKGFLIDVSRPSEVFGIRELDKLVGNIISLYFPSLNDQGISYFNVRGTEAVTGITASEANGAIELKKYSRSGMPLKQKPAMPVLKNRKIVLTWAHITRDNPDLENEDPIGGLDVISPTWFNLTDGSGGMANRASAAYVEAARKKGYQVWPLVSNGFSKANTSQLFNDTRAVNLFIARILCYAKLYELDGINIDFENVDAADRDKYVRFISLLGSCLKKEGLVSSVDVHVPGNSGLSRSHDRAGISKHVDYIMLMAYDEHWRTSPKAGSVAYMPWVEQAVRRTLEEGVPPGKLVLGVPFYMRKWEEIQSGHGKVKVKASTLTMAESDSIISERSISPIWLNDKGQHFYSFLSDGKTYKVWVENRDSIKAKLSLIEKYRLAGVAGWRKGHETPDIWQEIKSVMGSR